MTAGNPIQRTAFTLQPHPLGNRFRLSAFPLDAETPKYFPQRFASEFAGLKPSASTDQGANDFDPGVNQFAVESAGRCTR